VNLAAFLAHLADEPGWMDAERVDIMTRDTSGDTPLHAALWMGDDEAARALVDAGADVTALGDMSETPLHVTVAQGNAAIAKHLLAHGASWDVVSELGFSPRERARRSDNTELLALANA
jgi:ankyrin repeat protein